MRQDDLKKQLEHDKVCSEMSFEIVNLKLQNIKI